VPTIETLGELLGDLALEVVVDPAQPGDLRLHIWNGSRATTTARLKHDGALYIPKQFPSSLGPLVRFAPPSLPFGSTTKLVKSLSDFLSTYARLQPETTFLLVAFALATWFCDVTAVAPILYLLGPESEASGVLRLLGCVCRRSALLSDIDLRGLTAFPKGLGATLLLNHMDLGRRVKRILLASTERHFGVLRGLGRLDVYGARAFACTDFPPGDRGLIVSLPPTQDPPPLLSDAEGERIAHGFQAKLLRYRMANYSEVRDREIDCKAFVPEMRDEAQAWLAPICNCPELSRAVHAELLRQSEELAGTRFLDPKCVVTEAALFFCHKPEATQFLVGELAETVNNLLKGRHEEATLSDKRVGLILRELGVRGERVAAGYKVSFTDVMRERIHRLAHDFHVASLDDRVHRCRFCSGKQILSRRVQ